MTEFTHLGIVCTTVRAFYGKPNAPSGQTLQYNM